MDEKSRKLGLYILFTFVIAWIFQIVASLFALNGHQSAFSLILAVSMFVPMAGALLAGFKLKGMGWIPRFKNKKYIWYIAAFIGPIVFTALGALLFYVIFPKTFDPTFTSYMKVSLGQEAVDTLSQQGLTPTTYFWVAVLQASTYAPVINMFFAIGEEAGWRGAMYPVLKEKLGVNKGRLVGGAIWGAWHWPVIILAGYEYGKEYLGAPFVGPILFLVSSTVLGYLLDYAYDKTKCIWVPALGHGSFNAIAGVSMLCLNAEYMNLMTIGPAPVGIVSMIPLIATVVILLVLSRKK